MFIPAGYFIPCFPYALVDSSGLTCSKSYFVFKVFKYAMSLPVIKIFFHWMSTGYIFFRTFYCLSLVLAYYYFLWLDFYYYPLRMNLGRENFFSTFSKWCLCRSDSFRINYSMHLFNFSNQMKSVFSDYRRIDR